jgi:hypothetical protein
MLKQFRKQPTSKRFRAQDLRKFCAQIDRIDVPRSRQKMNLTAVGEGGGRGEAGDTTRTLFASTGNNQFVLYACAVSNTYSASDFWSECQ